MQSDNNLVLYDVAGKAIWSSGTVNKGMKPAKLINDGCNGVMKVVDNAGTVLWSISKTSSHTLPARFVV